MSFTTIISIVSCKLLRLKFLNNIRTIRFDNRESLESTNVPFMVTVDAVRSIFVPVDG